MSVAVPAFVDWAWRTFGRLVRIDGEVHETNVGSRRCLEKAGLAIEGRRTMAFVKNGVFGNVLLLGMLRPGSSGGEVEDRV